MCALKVAYYMNIGLRDNQEDSLFLNGHVVQENRFENALLERTNGDATVYAVCDGMGGLERGEWASRFVCESLSEKLHDIRHPGESIVNLLKEIQWEFEQRGAENTGTTIAGVVIEGDRTTVFNAGDSRVYKINRDGITYLSHDHSLVQEEIDRGSLSEEEAFTHPYRNLIGFGIGDVFRHEWAEQKKEIFVVNDRLDQETYYVLCTDGVNDVLQDREIYASLYPRPFDRLPDFIRCVTEKMKDNFSFILIGNAAG